jgi:hypothetical protein
MWWVVISAAAIWLVSIAGTTRKRSVQVQIGLGIMAVCAVAYVWVLIIGWLLAIVGLAMAIAGSLWRNFSKEERHQGAPDAAHPSGGLLWPGLGLVLAPFVNAFLLMPVLRIILK